VLLPQAIPNVRARAPVVEARADSVPAGSGFIWSFNVHDQVRTLGLGNATLPSERLYQASGFITSVSASNSESTPCCHQPCGTTTREHANLSSMVKCSHHDPFRLQSKAYHSTYPAIQQFNLYYIISIKTKSLEPQPARSTPAPLMRGGSQTRFRLETDKGAKLANIQVVHPGRPYSGMRTATPNWESRARPQMRPVRSSEPDASRAWHGLGRGRGRRVSVGTCNKMKESIEGLGA
jgi:hypothetical protein